VISREYLHYGARGGVNQEERGGARGDQDKKEKIMKGFKGERGESRSRKGGKRLRGALRSGGRVESSIPLSERAGPREKILTTGKSCLQSGSARIKTRQGTVRGTSVS